MGLVEAAAEECPALAQVSLKSTGTVRRFALSDSCWAHGVLALASIAAHLAWLDRQIENVFAEVRQLINDDTEVPKN
jgi:hypothetical protein